MEFVLYKFNHYSRHLKILATAIVQLILPVIIYGQVNIYNLSLKDSTKSFLYKGIENRLQIFGLSDTTGVYYSSKAITLPVNKIQNWNNKSNDKFDTLRLLRSDSVFYEKIYQIGTIPSPRVQLGEILKDSTTVQKVLNQKELFAVFPDCHLDIHLTITSYKLKLILKDQRNYLFEVNGSRLLSIHNYIIKTMKTGDQIIFSKIMAQGIFCPRALDDLKIIIE